jgi:hypothetical protein
MVIINSQNAQLANRLWGFSSFIANSIEHNYPLINLGFYKYRNYFEATQNNNFGRYPISIKRSGIGFLDYFYSNLFKTYSSFTYRKFGKTPTFGKLYRTNFTEDLTATVVDLNSPNFVKDAQTKKVLAQGWMFRDPINIRKHRAKIIDFFKPVEPYYTQVNQEIQDARKLADILIAVHIRRGDYATFADGKWFYSDVEYAEWMHQLENSYKAIGKTTAFFICSNEKINLEAYKNLNVITKSRHFIVDLYAMAECDAIIGPPSTYSQWAAYYGNKPLTMLLAGKQKLEIPKFNSAFLSEEDFPERNLYLF